MQSGFIKRFILFYYNGFRNMPRYGIKLWIINLIKLFVIFVVVKFLFFNDTLKTKYKNDKERSEHVLENLTNIK